MSPVPGFPSMKARRLRTLLQRELGYEVVRSTGSHRRLEAPGRPPITLAFDDGMTVGPALAQNNGPVAARSS